MSLKETDTHKDRHTQRVTSHVDSLVSLYDNTDCYQFFTWNEV